MKKKNNKINSIIVSLILSVALSVNVTFAWFFLNTDVEVEYGSEIVCETGTSLEVSMYEGLDSSGKEIWSTHSNKVSRGTVSAKLQDITGDGQNLYTAGTLKADSNGTLIPSNFAVASNIDSTGYGDFIELKVQLRSSSPMDIYFGGASSILPVYDGDNDNNIFGKFSKDYIAGAMRVAVIDGKSAQDGELKMIWAPNPNYYLKKENNGTYTFSTDGLVEEYKYYKLDEDGNSYLHTVTADEYFNKQFIYGNVGADDQMINGSPMLSTLSYQEKDDSANRRVAGFWYSDLVVRIWFEGTDREANQALSGGQAKMNLLFNGIQRKEVSQANEDALAAFKLVSINGLYGLEYQFKNYTEDMYFSTNGKDWTKIKITGSSTNLPNTASIKSVIEKSKDGKTYFIYLKIPETLDHKESVIKYVYKK